MKIALMIVALYFLYRIIFDEKKKRQSEIDETNLMLDEVLNPKLTQYIGRLGRLCDEEMFNLMQNQFREHYTGAAHTPSESSACKEEKVINPTLEITESKEKEAE